MNRILILSDDRMGHLNQSLAFVKYLGLPYEVRSVTFRINSTDGFTMDVDFLNIIDVNNGNVEI